MVSIIATLKLTMFSVLILQLNCIFAIAVPVSVSLCIQVGFYNQVKIGFGFYTIYYYHQPVDFSITLANICLPYSCILFSFMFEYKKKFSNRNSARFFFAYKNIVLACKSYTLQKIKLRLHQ